MKASRRSSWRNATIAAGQPLACILTTAASGPQKAAKPCRLAKTPEVVAIGECGLDFNRNFSTPEEQEKAFTAQLALAAELDAGVYALPRRA
jgi:Tat protein secretion system quality control protein TatD with DNase activity